MQFLFSKKTPARSIPLPQSQILRDANISQNANKSMFLFPFQYPTSFKIHAPKVHLKLQMRSLNPRYPWWHHRGHCVWLYKATCGIMGPFFTEWVALSVTSELNCMCVKSVESPFNVLVLVVCTWDWRGGASWWWSHQSAPRRSCWWLCFLTHTSTKGSKEIRHNLIYFSVGYSLHNAWHHHYTSLYFFVNTEKATINYLNELRLPGVEGEGAYFGEMDSQAPVREGNH